MRNLILRLKHWQVFALVVGSIAVYQNAMLLSAKDFDEYISLMKYLAPCVIIISFGSYFNWLFSLASYLRSKISNGMKYPYWFVVLFIYASGYAILMPLYFIFIAKGNFADLTLLYLLQTLFFIAVTYCLIHVSRLLKTVELGSPARFEDFFSDVILLFLFPVGIWTIQPRVNRLFSTPVDSAEVR